MNKLILFLVALFVASVLSRSRFSNSDDKEQSYDYEKEYREETTKTNSRRHYGDYYGVDHDYTDHDSYTHHHDDHTDLSEPLVANTNALKGWFDFYVSSAGKLNGFDELKREAFAPLDTRGAAMDQVGTMYFDGLGGCYIEQFSRYQDETGTWWNPGRGLDESSLVYLWHFQTWDCRQQCQYSVQSDGRTIIKTRRHYAYNANVVAYLGYLTSPDQFFFQVFTDNDNLGSSYAGDEFAAISLVTGFDDVISQSAPGATSNLPFFDFSYATGTATAVKYDRPSPSGCAP